MCTTPIKIPTYGLTLAHVSVHMSAHNELIEYKAKVLSWQEYGFEANEK